MQLNMILKFGLFVDLFDLLKVFQWNTGRYLNKSLPQYLSKEPQKYNFHHNPFSR